MNFFTEKFAGIKNLFYLCTRKSETTATAKIAQLVEHDLAKVGVAGSSPVFRSEFFELEKSGTTTQRENSSVGRARPCQGRGRGFESRFSLRVF